MVTLQGIVLVVITEIVPVSMEQPAVMEVVIRMKYLLGLALARAVLILVFMMLIVFAP